MPDSHNPERHLFLAGIKTGRFLAADQVDEVVHPFAALFEAQGRTTVERRR